MTGIECPTCGGNDYDPKRTPWERGDDTLEWEPADGHCPGCGHPGWFPERENMPNQENDRPLRDAVREVLRLCPDWSSGDDAPGHSHMVSGVWDRDNGEKAGTPCEWCAAWKRMVELAGL